MTTADILQRAHLIGRIHGDFHPDNRLNNADRRLKWAAQLKASSPAEAEAIAEAKRQLRREHSQAWQAWRQFIAAERQAEYEAALAAIYARLAAVKHPSAVHQALSRYRYARRIASSAQKAPATPAIRAASAVAAAHMQERYSSTLAAWELENPGSDWNLTTAYYE